MNYRLAFLPTPHPNRRSPNAYCLPPIAYFRLPSLLLCAAVALLCGLTAAAAFGQAPKIPALPPGAPAASAPSAAVRKASQQWQTAVNLQKAKKYPEAIAAYNEFLRGIKQSGLPANTALAAYQNLTAIYRAQGNVKELIGSLKAWSALAPENPAMHAELSSIYASPKIQQFDEAAKEARQALALKPSIALAAAAHSTLGIVAISRKDFAAAEQEFGASVKLLPSNSQMQYNYGLALAERKKFAPALAVMHKAVALNPKMAGAWYYIGMLSETQGNYPAAIKAFNQAIHLAPTDPTIRFDLARAQIRSNDLEGAISSYLIVLELAPQSVPARIAVAQCYLQQKNYAAARPHFAEAAKLAPKNAPVLAGLAQCEMMLSYQPQDTAGRRAFLTKAEEHYKAAAALEPALLTSENGLSRFYERTGNYGKAQEIYRKRIEADPNDFVNYNALAGTFLMQRKVDEALGVWHRYRELYPADPQPYMRTAETLEAQAKWTDAIAEWKQLLTQKLPAGTEAGAMVAIGKDLAHAGKPKEATDELEAVLKLDTSGASAPKDTRVATIATMKAERLEAMQQLAQIAESANSLDEAIRWQQQIKAEEAAIAEHNNGAPNAATYLALSRLYQRAKKPELAIKELDALIQTRQARKESFAPAYEELAQVYKSLKRDDEAVAAYRRAAIYSKEPLNDRLRVAEVYQRGGRLPLAIAEFEAIGKDFPKEGRALAPLALAYRQAGRDADAIRVYDNLLQNDRRATWVRDQKAVVLTHMKRFDEARALYEEQLTTNAQNRQLYADIAFVFQSEGRADAFLDWLKPRFEKAPANATLMAVILDEAARQKKEDLGWTLLRASAEKHKGQRAVLEATASLMVQRGKKEDAVTLYRQIAAQYPKDLTAQVTLADQLYAAGHKDEASKLYSGLLARTDLASGEKLNIRRQYARSCAEQGNSGEAIAQLQEVVKADPNDFDSATRLALTLEGAGRGAEAFPILQTLANRELYGPLVRAQIHDKIGALYLARGDKDSAEAEYRKSLQLNAKDTAAQAALQQLGVK